MASGVGHHVAGQALWVFNSEMSQSSGRWTPPGQTSRRVDEDWYARELGEDVFSRVEFVDCDLTEVSSVGTTFSECAFRNVAFNVSRHSVSSFVNCTFTRCNFFDAAFVGCKVLGSAFDRCDFRLTRIDGGNWSLVRMRGAALSTAVFTGVRMIEADLSSALIQNGTLRDCDLKGTDWHGANLSGADLRGSDLSSLDPAVVQLKGALVTGQQAVVVAQLLGLVVEPD